MKRIAAGRRPLPAILVLALFGLLLVGTGPAFADEKTPAPETQDELLLDEQDGAIELGSDLPDMSGALVKLAVMLMLLLAALAAGVILFQKFARGRLKLGGANRPLRLVDRLSLGPKTGVCLLNVSGRCLLLGVAEKEISVLMEVTTASEGDAEGDFSGALAGFDSAAKAEARTIALKES